VSQKQPLLRLDRSLLFTLSSLFNFALYCFDFPNEKAQKAKSKKHGKTGGDIGDRRYAVGGGSSTELRRAVGWASAPWPWLLLKMLLCTNTFGSYMIKVRDELSLVSGGLDRR
jgi:hypothetical protein